MTENKNEKKTSKPAQITVILRMVAGAYLIYLAVGLLGEAMKATGGRQLLQIGSMLLFMAVGAVLCVWSLRKLIKGEYLHPGEGEDESGEETQVNEEPEDKEGSESNVRSDRQEIKE